MITCSEMRFLLWSIIFIAPVFGNKEHEEERVSDQAISYFPFVHTLLNVIHNLSEVKTMLKICFSILSTWTDYITIKDYKHENSK